MTREELQVIIENEETDIGDKITQILNRHHVELKQAKEDSSEKERADNLEAQLKETQKTLNSIKRNNQDNEALQEKITQSQARIKELETSLKDSRINSSIQVEAVKFGAKNPEHVAKLIDRSQCGIDKDDQVYGITEQFKALKESDGSYLFNIQAEDVADQRQAYEPNRGETKQANDLGVSRALEIGRMRAQKKAGITQQES